MADTKLNYWKARQNYAPTLSDIAWKALSRRVEHGTYLRHLWSQGTAEIIGSSEPNDVYRLYRVGPRGGVMIWVSLTPEQRDILRRDL